MFSCFFIIKKKKTVLKRNFQTGLWISISWSQVPTHEDVGEGMESLLLIAPKLLKVSNSTSLHTLKNSEFLIHMTECPTIPFS